MDESFAELMDRMKAVKGGWWTSQFAKAKGEDAWFGRGSPYDEQKKVEANLRKLRSGRSAGLDTFVRRDGSIGQVRPRYRINLPNSPFRTTTDEFGYKYRDSMRNQGRGMFLSPSFFYVREDGTLTPSKYEAAKYEVEDSRGTKRQYPVTVELLQTKGALPEDRRITLLTRWKDQNRSKGTATRRPSDLLQAIRDQLNARSDESAKEDYIESKFEPEYIKALVENAKSKGLDIGQPADLRSAAKAYADAVADSIGDRASRPFIIRDIMDNVIPSIKDDVRSTATDESGMPLEDKFGRMFEGERRVSGMRRKAAQDEDFRRWDEYNDEVEDILQKEIEASKKGTLTTDYPKYMGEAGWRYRPPSPNVYGRFIPLPDGSYRADYSEEKKRILANLLSRDQRFAEPEEEAKETPEVDPVFERIIRQGTPGERQLKAHQEQRRAERVLEAKEKQSESNEQAIQDAVFRRGQMGEGNRFQGVTDVVDAYQGAIAPSDIDSFLDDQQKVLDYTNAELDAFKKKFSLVTKLSHIAAAVNNFEDHDRKVLFDPATGEAYGSKDNRARAIDLLAKQKKRIAFLKKFGVPVGDDNKVPDGIVRSLEQTAAQSDKAVAKVDEIVNTRARIEDALKRGVDIRDNPKVMEHINAIPGLIDQYAERLDAVKRLQPSSESLKTNRANRAQRLKDYFERMDPEYRFFLDKAFDQTLDPEMRQYALQQLTQLATRGRSVGVDDNYVDGREPPLFGPASTPVPNAYDRTRLGMLSDAYQTSRILEKFGSKVDEAVQSGKLTPEEGAYLKRNANNAAGDTGRTYLATLNDPVKGRVNYLVGKAGLENDYKVLRGRQTLGPGMKGLDVDEGKGYVQNAIDALNGPDILGAENPEASGPLWKMVLDAMKPLAGRRTAEVIGDDGQPKEIPVREYVSDVVMRRMGVHAPGKDDGPDYARKYNATKNAIENLYNRADEWNFAKMIGRKLNDLGIQDEARKARIKAGDYQTDEDWEDAYDLYTTARNRGAKEDRFNEVIDALYNEYKDKNPDDDVDRDDFIGMLNTGKVSDVTNAGYDSTGTNRSYGAQHKLLGDANSKLYDSNISDTGDFDLDRLTSRAEEQLASQLKTSGVDYEDFDRFMYDWHENQEEDSNFEEARKKRIEADGGVYSHHLGASVNPRWSFVPKDPVTQYVKYRKRSNKNLNVGDVYDLENKLNRYNSLYSDMEAQGKKYTPKILGSAPYRGASTPEAQPEPVEPVVPETPAPATDIKPETASDPMDNETKDQVQKSRPTMTLKEMMDAIRKSDSKEGHPYGKPVQGSVFAYGSTAASYGDGRDCPMPETVPQGQVNGEGASTRRLDL